MDHKDQGIPSRVQSGRSSVLRSTLLVASPTSYVVLDAADRAHTVQEALGAHPGLPVAGLFLAAALLVHRAPAWGRSVASLAALLQAAASAFLLTQFPALALTVLLGLSVGLTWLWHDELPRTAFAAEVPKARGVGPECFLALSAWLLVGPAQAVVSDEAKVAAVVALALCMILGALRLVGASTKQWLRLVVMLLLALPPLLVLIAAVIGAPPPRRTIGILAIGPLLLLLWSWSTSKRDDEPSWWLAVIEHPARLLVVTFFSLCCIGAALLSLPGSSSTATLVSFLDAVFTAVSAVCVTGLIVLDTPTAWTGMGQAVILVLIQLGGLGIMTFYAAALPLLGRRLSMRHERAVAGALSIDDRGRLYASLGRVLGVTIGCEIIGTLLLFLGFSTDGVSNAAALWKSLFTAVSAFCNAGFALDTDSLVGYGSNALVLHTVAGLVIAGGLSPVAVLAIPQAFSRRRRALSLEIKLIFVAKGSPRIRWPLRCGL